MWGLVRGMLGWWGGLLFRSEGVLEGKWVIGDGSWETVCDR
jgi:hypothetical protein